MKVLAVADSDSYLKWAACLLDGLPAGSATELVVIRTPIAPSSGQIRAAVAGTRSGAAAARSAGPAVEDGDDSGLPPVLSARRLRRLAERFQPDAVLVACTGPVVDVLVSEVLDGLSPRPVFVSGLPGISVPATDKAWLFRSGCDLFVLHSGREVGEFSAVAERLGGGGAIGLARLPFLDHGTTVAPTGPRDRVVFATQAKVPRRREDRESVLFALAALADRRPDLDVVVKLRARDGERQTHNERYHYERLWRELVAQGRVRDGGVRFADGAMHEHLAHAVGFVTVSSTAALEAIAQSVPLLVLSDFGVSAEMINLVFEGSGCLGTLEELAKGEFRDPLPAWCQANYFHDRAAADWAARLAAMSTEARAGRLRPAASLLDGPQHAAARRRARLRVEIPPDMLRVGYRAKRRVRRYLKAIT
ncbi:hypothetical protein Misp01_17570 [Microtetraspora sp. NBRC 13810]|uniref:DUF6716 putative glycosyltransferase n=1 Tax=Microtetraspora sp. NBRC 13810 TaxID=3030990 RepID=UPI0024A2E380|nr:DUF6716 putative glycosyltransferase [Microtetraspora sp. NBRC 13810]GLW06627.1 hypothetical protein Misp01_17570 [Microtetraspora sp. NBRC 13810]